MRASVPRAGYQASINGEFRFCVKKWAGRIPIANPCNTMLCSVTFFFRQWRLSHPRNRPLSAMSGHSPISQYIYYHKKLKSFAGVKAASHTPHYHSSGCSPSHSPDTLPSHQASTGEARMRVLSDPVCPGSASRQSNQIVLPITQSSWISCTSMS